MVYPESPNFLTTAKQLLQRIKSIRQEIAIVIVANVKGRTITDDYPNHSVATDFFSEQELEEIVTAYRDFGFYTHVYVDELDFMQDYLTKNLSTIPRLKKIIYNTSQKGIGSSRQSLIPAFCKLNHIPYIGSDAYVSSLCRHKYHFNKLLCHYHNNLPKSWMYQADSGWLLNQHPPFGEKVILKPIYEAASIGISTSSVIIYEEDSDKAIRLLCKEFQQPIEAEQFISGFEVEVPIIISGKNFFALGPVGSMSQGNKLLGDKIFTYEDVYSDNYSFYNFDEENNELSKRILQCASISAQILGIEDFGRIDFRVSEDGNFYLTDITTNPHTVKHSDCNYAFQRFGFSHSELLSTLAALVGLRYQWI